MADIDASPKSPRMPNRKNKITRFVHWVQSRIFSDKQSTNRKTHGYHSPNSCTSDTSAVSSRSDFTSEKYYADYSNKNYLYRKDTKPHFRPPPPDHASLTSVSLNSDSDSLEMASKYLQHRSKDSELATIPNGPISFPSHIKYFGYREEPTRNGKGDHTKSRSLLKNDKHLGDLLGSDSYTIRALGKVYEWLNWDAKDSIEDHETIVYTVSKEQSIDDETDDESEEQDNHSDTTVSRRKPSDNCVIGTEEDYVTARLDDDLIDIESLPTRMSDASGDTLSWSTFYDEYPPADSTIESTYSRNHDDNSFESSQNSDQTGEEKGTSAEFSNEFESFENDKLRIPTPPPEFRDDSSDHQSSTENKKQRVKFRSLTIQTTSDQNEENKDGIKQSADSKARHGSLRRQVTPFPKPIRLQQAGGKGPSIGDRIPRSSRNSGSNSDTHSTSSGNTNVDMDYMLNLDDQPEDLTEPQYDDILKANVKWCQLLRENLKLDKCVSGTKPLKLGIARWQRRGDGLGMRLARMDTYDVNSEWAVLNSKYNYIETRKTHKRLPPR